MTAQLFAGLIFGSIGFVAFVYGKKESRVKTMLLGLALMGYPYLIPGTVAVFVVGALLTAALLYFRNE